MERAGRAVGAGRGLTALAGVVHQDDFVQQVARRSVDDAVHRAQQRRPRLVVEDDDDAGVRVRADVRVLFALAPVNQTHTNTRDQSTTCQSKHTNTQ